LFYDKNSERVKFVSPVSGKIKEIVRGERRKVLEIKIEPDKNISYKKIEKLKSEESAVIIDFLVENGLWPFVKQRPYDVIANPNSNPKEIFISGFDSSPLSADFDFITKDEKESISKAISILSKLCSKPINISLRKESQSFLRELNDVIIHNVSGPHPSGNLSTIINKVCPINKGDIIWTLNLPDLIIIGKALLEGKFLAERLIALAGSSVTKPKYIKTLIGSNISSFLKLNENNSRVISGNVLTGTKLGSVAHLRYYSNEITAIPEGDDYDLFGWAKPMFDKFSVSRALTFSWLSPNKKYDLNTNTNGEHRAFVVTGSFEEVFPLDIYPMQILKACMYKDLDEMEALGMYEVSPEDFALTEFICVSKQPHQNIIREGLDLMKKEIG
jgi:Na+-transporting NADH:ubiquinone oxidoreductase subunit A